MTPCESLFVSALSFAPTSIDRFEAILFDLNPVYVSVIDQLSEQDARQMRDYVNSRKKGMASFIRNGELFVIQFGGKQ